MTTSSDRPTPAQLGQPRPVPGAPSAPPTATTPPASDPHEFGRADADGTVWVRTAAGDVRVGQYTIGTPEEGLAFYARKYDDLRAEAELTRQRLADGLGTPEAASAVAVKVREQVAEPRMVGDLEALARVCDGIDAEIEAYRLRRSEQKAAARAAALAAREVLVAEAESLVGSTQWKATGDRYRELLEQWKSLPHADRSGEQALWKRFSAARSAFDKARRVHFAQLGSQRAEASTVKEDLIRQAEALTTSTDWGPTTAAYRSLLDRWKSAPRGSHRDEQSWWTRFKAAQDAFFAAKSAANEERETELRANLEVKEALLVEAKALLPVTDIEATRTRLADIQRRWEAAGMVPRGDRDRVEGALRAVEDALRSAEGERWRRTDPAKKAFAESTVEKFRAALAKAERAADEARAAGNDAAAARAAESVESTRALLEAAERSLAEYS